jgi:serine/threonine-protein kinase
MKELGNMLETGTVLNDKWVILELINRGGMGEVYRAHQLNLKRDIAIKVISQKWLQSFNGDTEDVERDLARFRREVQAMAQIRHPNIIQVHDYGSVTLEKGTDEIPIEYIAMEYIPGGSLRSTMSEEGFYPDEAVMRDWLSRYFLPVLDGVQAIHQQGIVHRDLKPENVLLDGNTPKVADFGLARSCRLKPVTRTVDIKGTTPYMSPEQFFDFGKVDEQADIYSLGKMIHEAVCGRISKGAQPFKKACLTSPDTPFFQKLNLIIQDATAETREKRISSVQDLKLRLLELIEDTSIRTDSYEQIVKKDKRKHKAGLMIAGIFLALVVAVLVVYHFVAEPEKTQRLILLSNPPPQAVAPGGKGVTVPTVPDEQATSLSKKIEGENSTSFRIIPGGKITLVKKSQEGVGETLNLEPFYLSDTPVTNQQYVDFLNQVLSSIRLENGHVVHEDKTWLRLGEVIRGYKPIVFREGQFHIKEAMHAACPVIRVTGYGARAYADHFGMQLPTDAQWLLAVMHSTTDAEIQQSPSSVGTERLQLPIPSPVMLYKPNKCGIRGLNRNLGEWGLSGKDEEQKEEESEYIVLGGLKDYSQTNVLNPSVIWRNPEKSYADVGFRTVLSEKPVNE